MAKVGIIVFKAELRIHLVLRLTIACRARRRERRRRRWYAKAVLSHNGAFDVL